MTYHIKIALILICIYLFINASSNSIHNKLSNEIEIYDNDQSDVVFALSEYTKSTNKAYFSIEMNCFSQCSFLDTFMLSLNSSKTQVNPLSSITLAIINPDTGYSLLKNKIT
mgnify:CR=1 FL=1